jgi:hypothetical protein
MADAQDLKSYFSAFSPPHVAAKRPLLDHALRSQMEQLQQALIAEESAEREQDRRYWSPLRAELEKLRHHNPSRDVG